MGCKGDFSMTDYVTLAGGCFWCTEAVFKDVTKELSRLYKEKKAKDAKMTGNADTDDKENLSELMNNLTVSP